MTHTSFATMSPRPPTLTRINHTGESWFALDGWVQSTPTSDVAELPRRAPPDPHCPREGPHQTFFAKVYPGHQPLDEAGGSGLPNFTPLLPSR